MRAPFAAALALLLAPLAAHAGGKAPWAEVDGSAVAAAGEVGLVVLAVDGKTVRTCRGRGDDAGATTGSLLGGGPPRASCKSATTGLKLAPGARALRVASLRDPEASQPFAFEVAACTRYRLVARHDGDAFAVVVADAQPLAGCRAPEAAVAAAPEAPATAPADAGTPSQ
jgi:hypothetical protein